MSNNMRAPTSIALVGVAICRTVHAASSDDWRSRSIYQIITDRFALPDGSTTQACDAETGIYCNGTWQGLINQLDYVAGMGFDAIWISPVTQQLEGNTADGSAYHGYWQTNINAVNSHFGSSDDLKNLAAEVHSRDMYFMVDLVTNHYAALGPAADIDYSQFTPFNDASYFHDYCQIDYSNLTNTTDMEQCWEGSTNVPLPDLRTEESNVSTIWNSWVAEFISNYSIDGLRIDSVLEVDTAFWSSFQSSAGVYSLGEVNAGSASLVCGFQNYVPGVFNYATYFTLVNAFQNSSGSIYNLASMISTTQNDCADFSLLGTFSENHDVPRFAFLNDDIAAAKNVITFTMLTDGIPVIYQGQEQHYNAEGSSDGSVPYNREALWLSGYNTSATLYTLIASLNEIRKQVISDDSSFTTTANTVTYQDYTNIGMQKGSLVTVLTNVGSSASTFNLSIPSSLQSTEMTELLTCNTLTTLSGGNLTVPVTSGLPSIYYPTANIGSLCSSSSKRKRLARSRHFKLD